jgi:hypothetical protein
MIEIDDSDSNTLIIVKLSIAMLTVIVMGFSIIRTGWMLLKRRSTKVGFTKE